MRISQHYTHHPEYVEEIAIGLIAELEPRCGESIGPPKIVTEGRNLRNLFFGERIVKYSGKKVLITHTLRKGHDNDLTLYVEDETPLGKDIGAKGIVSIKELQEYFAEK